MTDAPKKGHHSFSEVLASVEKFVDFVGGARILCCSESEFHREIFMLHVNTVFINEDMSRVHLRLRPKCVSEKVKVFELSVSVRTKVKLKQHLRSQGTCTAKKMQRGRSKASFARTRANVEIVRDGLP